MLFVLDAKYHSEDRIRKTFCAMQRATGDDEKVRAIYDAFVTEFAAWKTFAESNVVEAGHTQILIDKYIAARDALSLLL